MFVRYQQVASSAAVKNQSNLTIPGAATHAMLQAETQDIRYTMDNATTPTSTVGMLLKAGLAPEQFLIEDLRRIHFTQAAGGAGLLNIHYFCGGIQ